MVVCLERGANDLHMVQLTPLPLHHLLLQQNPEWFILLVPAYPGCPGKKTVKMLCVCVCWYHILCHCPMVIVWLMIMALHSACVSRLTLCRAKLMLCWMTICGYIIVVCSHTPSQLSLLPSVRWEMSTVQYTSHYQ